MEAIPRSCGPCRHQGEGLSRKDSRRCGSSLRSVSGWRRSAYGKDVFTCAQREYTSCHHHVDESTDEQSPPSDRKLISVQDASAVYRVEADALQEPVALPDSELRYLREQAAYDASFVDLVVDLVPLGALIAHERTCSNSPAEITGADTSSRGSLRWQQRCARYDPDVLRATSRGLENHVGNQEKKMKSLGPEGHGRKRLDKMLSRTTEHRRDQQEKRRFQKKRVRSQQQLVQHHEVTHTGLQRMIMDCANATDRSVRRESQKEGSPRDTYARGRAKKSPGVGDVAGDSRGCSNENRHAFKVTTQSAGNGCAAQVCSNSVGEHSLRPESTSHGRAGGMGKFSRGNRSSLKK